MATKTKEVKEVKAVEKEVAPEFRIVVKIDAATYEGSGATGLEALRAIVPPTNDLISTGTVTISHGDKSKEMLFPTKQLRRLLNKYNQEVLINDLLFGLI